MKLLIKKPFELDVELVDQMPKYLKIKSNWVYDQVIEVSDAEMNQLLFLLNYCSFQFNHTTIEQIDEITLSWG